MTAAVGWWIGCPKSLQYPTAVIPAKAGIQYTLSVVLNYARHRVRGRPVEPGENNRGVGEPFVARNARDDGDRGVNKILVLR